MDQISHDIQLDASAKNAYDAVATPEGQQGWWCQDSDIATEVGHESELRFNKDGNIVTMRFRLDELDENQRVVWTCVGNDHPMWLGSQLTWAIEGSGSGSKLHFTHDGLAGEGAPPAMIADTWKHFMGSLKSYVESGQGQPW